MNSRPPSGTFSPVTFPELEKDMDCAEAWLKDHRQALLADQETVASLTELGARADFLAAFMNELKMAGICRKCGSNPGGGCCSPEMGGDCDSLLVVINKLAGCEVSRQRLDGIECFFLGPDGCSLRFKPFFCLNYNCRKIKATLGHETLRELERLTGRLLSQQYLLEERLRNFFRLKTSLLPG